MEEIGMFVQVIRGRASEPGALHERFESWEADLASDAEGWVGTTAGVTDDGEFIALVRFESEAAARRNSDRPEQGAWWQETEPLLDDVVFHDTDDVVVWLGGADTGAEFVQVMEGQVLDRVQARQLMDGMEESVAEVRPDVIGSVLAIHGDRFTQAVYFTDEESARAGERRDDERQDDEEMRRFAAAVDVRSYLDLRAPWHQVAAGR
jgi:hypothetical protein